MIQADKDFIFPTVENSSLRFSRQEYCSGLPCPTPGDLLYPGMEPDSLMSPALVGEFFSTSATSEVRLVL